jgi:hypothetical protein
MTIHLLVPTRHLQRTWQLCGEQMLTGVANLCVSSHLDLHDAHQKYNTLIEFPFVNMHIRNESEVLQIPRALFRDIGVVRFRISSYANGVPLPERIMIVDDNIRHRLEAILQHIPG